MARAGDGDANQPNLDPAVPKPEKSPVDPGIKDPAVTKDEASTDEEEKDPDGIVWKERPASNEEREKRLIIGAGALYTMYKSYLSEDEAMKLSIQGVQRERESWLKLKEK